MSGFAKTGSNWGLLIERDGLSPSMLRTIRVANELTQGALADAVGVAQATISKWEDGVVSPSTVDIERLAEALHCHPGMLSQYDAVIGIGPCTHYRKRSSVGVRQINTIESRANLMRISAGRLLSRIEDFPIRFEEMELEQYGTPEKVAIALRANWQVPSGPIENLVELIESAGGVVIECNFGGARIDAMSQWRGGLPPVFFLNRSAPPDRARFTLAHEIGHIVMHRVVSPRAEEEADQFASEFLMPSRQIKRDLSNISLPRALELKRVWKVSMAALIRKAKDLGAITPQRYRSLYSQLSRAGYRKNEPGILPREVPSTVARIVDALKSEAGYSLDQIAKFALCRDADQFVARFLPDSTEARIRVLSGT